MAKKAKVQSIVVNCAYDKMIPIADLKPNPKNPNQHPQRQLEMLAKIIKTQGWRAPITVSNRSGFIVRGHGRLAAAQLLGLADAPVDFQDYDSDDAERADLLADNRIAELAETADEMLANMLREFSPGFDMEIAGFSLEESLALMGDSMSLTKDAESLAPEDDEDVLSKTPNVQLFSKEQIKAEIIEESKKWPSALQDLVKYTITKHMAMGEFNDLASDTAAPKCAFLSLLFNPHRLTTAGKAGKDVVSMYTKEKFRETQARFISEYFDGKLHPTRFMKNTVVGVGGVEYISEFPPTIARNLYRKFVPNGGKILDPCHGWGGRVVGFMAANYKNEAHYVGFDPSTKSHEGLKKIIAFLKTSATKATAEVHCTPFEDAKLKKESYDFALTSPPYYDTEHYADEATQSFVKYKTFEEWCSKFYYPMIDKVMEALKPGCSFVLNVGDKKYPLSTLAINWVKSKGHSASVMSEVTLGGKGIGERANTEISQGEPFLCITKAGKRAGTDEKLTKSTEKQLKNDDSEAKIELHRATNDEFSAVFSVFQQYKALFPHIRHDYVKREIAKNNVIFDSGVVLVAVKYQKKTKLGSISALAGDWIAHQIAASTQGDGSAKRVFTAFLQSIKRPCWITVRSANERAIAFYEKCGFVKVGTIEWKEQGVPLPGTVLKYSNK